MVLQKRLDYGFIGHQAPFVPRAPRSIRKRGSTGRKKSDENSMCAIDILATIAGKILQEGDIASNPGNSLTKNDLGGFANPKTEIERPKDETRATEDTFDHGKCEEDTIITQNQDHVYTLKDSPFSVLTTSRDSTDKEITGRSNDFVLKVEGGSCENMSIGTTSGDLFHSEDHVHCDPSPLHGDRVKLVSSRDDDENTSGCTHPIATTSKLFRAPPPRIGDRRIRKVLASNNWKPKLASRIKEENTSHTSGELNPIFHVRKTCYNGQTSQRNYPFKKRRLFGSMCDYGRGHSSSGISCSLEKGVNRNRFNSGSKLQGRRPATSSAARQNTLRSRDSHVKLRIKSFRVPELFIEISETATVGSLKRRVMEAVMNILGGGLRVGVLLQGKKVRDDNKTLLQTGISHDNQPDALGFVLEPNSSQPLNTQPLIDPLTRYLPPSELDVLPQDPYTGKLMTFTESDHDSASSPTDTSIVKSAADSKAIVPVEAMTAEALSVVPMHRKSKRSDASQRRIRRPFSVSEVEALVHAVEKLGTGRWRDVKLRAFDNAKHRTYVDLKDKWKTLVHTARISPQQRRGEPVPQQLLDRVLAAHAYWTQNQAKPKQSCL